MVSTNGHKGSQSASLLETQLRPLIHLEATYRAFDAAERELSTAIGVPLCIPDCGRCCAVTTVMTSGLEVQFLISWLLGQRGLEQVITRCEGWLLDRDPRLTIYGLSGTLPQNQWDRLRPEVDTLLLERPCPMLAEDQSCLIYGARPLACHTYGITHMPAPFCPRPLSRLESEDVRAHIGEHSPVGRKLKRMTQQTLAAGGVRFLATALYALLRPEKLKAFATDNLIASAKLVVLQQNTAIIFQSQLDEVWRQASVATVAQ